MNQKNLSVLSSPLHRKGLGVMADTVKKSLSAWTMAAGVAQLLECTDGVQNFWQADWQVQ